MSKKRPFDVLSPDGFSIERDGGYHSEMESKKAFLSFLERFRKQGYYSSIKFGRIPFHEIEGYCTFIKPKTDE